MTHLRPIYVEVHAKFRFDQRILQQLIKCSKNDTKNQLQIIKSHFLPEDLSKTQQNPYFYMHFNHFCFIKNPCQNCRDAMKKTIKKNSWLFFSFYPDSELDVLYYAKIQRNRTKKKGTLFSKNVLLHHTAKWNFAGLELLLEKKINIAGNLNDSSCD